jgi:hypothetical protein
VIILHSQQNYDKTKIFFNFSEAQIRKENVQNCKEERLINNVQLGHQLGSAEVRDASLSAV